MEQLRSMVLTGTTNAGGDLTVNAEFGVFGHLDAVEWVIGTFDAGVDATLSVQKTGSGVASTLLTLTDANANAWYRPREVAHGNTGTALTGTAGGDRVMPVIDGTLRLVVAQGGNTKTGSLIVYYYSRS